MPSNAEITWLTLLGLSLLFVGGFVLWVYGAQAPQPVTTYNGPEADAPRKLQDYLIQWFLLYGAAAIFAGIGCLLTATVLIL